MQHHSGHPSISHCLRTAFAGVILLSFVGYVRGNDIVSAGSHVPATVVSVTLAALPSSGQAPLSVNFTASCTTCVAWVWDFGDGNSAAGASTEVHSYQLPGTYYVIVAATDKTGKSGSVQAVVTAQTVNACGPPSYSCSRSDVAPIVPTAPPQLGSNKSYYGGHLGAGTVAVDPSYNNRILRVSDANTEASHPGASFATGSSAEKNVTSFDETIFMMHGYNGLCFFSYDEMGFTATFQLCSAVMGNGGDFGYTPLDNDAFYSWYQNKLYRFVINTSVSPWKISADPAFNSGIGYFDPDNSTCLNGTIKASKVPWFTGDSAISSDDQTFIVAVGPEQDKDPYFVVWNQAKGCQWMNVTTWEVSTGWNTGLANPTNVVFASGVTPLAGGIHNAQIDRSGSYGVLTINGTSLNYKVFWTLGTNNLDDRCVKCQSHWACDFGLCFWSANGTLSQLPMGSSTFVPDMNPLVTQPLEDVHMSHANASTTVKFPYLAAYQPPGASTVNAVWDDEIVGVSFDGSQETVRFNKTWSSGYGGFNTSARCSISRQGNYALCNSDYQMYNLDKGFGNGLSQDTCDHTLLAGTYQTNGCRTDVLLFELK